MDPQDAREQAESALHGDGLVHLVLPVGDVPMASLLRAQAAFHDLLREVSRSIAATLDDPVTWVVESVSEGSTDYALAPNPGSTKLPTSTLDRMVEAVPAGISILRERAERPPHFTDKALTLTATLSTVPLPWLRTRNGAAEVEITRSAGLHAQRILAMPYTSDFGTVEGRLEAVNVHGGRRQFVIYDDLTGERIECHFGHRIATDEIKVDRRVAVTGEIRSRENGEIVSVIAERIEVFPPDDELPTSDEVLGILAR